MSTERCLSLDRGKRQQQNVVLSGGYMPERSPRRTPPRNGSPQYSPSTPEILRDSFPGGLPAYSFDEFDLCSTPKRLTRPLELQYEHAQEANGPQRLRRPPKVPQPEDLPDEYLEDFGQPSFYEPPANSSFDEVMCILATPPSRHQSPVAHPLYPKAIGNEDECQQATDHTVNMQIASSPALCPYKIPPLPDDPYDIPPHPKDPNDVVGFIRRSRAIHRLKALQDAEAAKKLPKGAVKRGVRGALARKNPPLVVPKKSSTVGKIHTKKVVSQPQKPKGAVRKLMVRPSSPEHPPDYIAPEYAAAILRARQLAGLKTRNPKLLPKSKIPPTAQPRAFASPPPPKLTPSPATYSSIVARAAAIRAKKKTAPAELFRQKDAEAGLCPIMTREYVDDIDHHQVMRLPHYREGTAGEFKNQALDEFEELERRDDPVCVAEAYGKYAGELSRNASLDEFEELERQTVAECIAEAHGIHDGAQSRNASLDEFVELERQTVAECIAEAHGIHDGAHSRNASLDEFEELERQTVAECIAEAHGIHAGAHSRNASLDEFEELERQMVAECIAEAHGIDNGAHSRNASLDEFEEIERQMVAEYIAETQGKYAAELSKNVSLDEFEEIERQTAESPERESPAPKQRVCPSNAANLQPKQLDSGQPQSAVKDNNIADQIRLLSSAKPKSVAEANFIKNRINDLRAILLASGESKDLKRSQEYSMRKRINELRTKLLDSAETPKNRKKARARNIMQEAEASPVFEMPPVIRFLDLMRRREAMTAEPSTELDLEECMMPEHAIDSKQFQDIADWNLTNISGTSDICPSPARAVAPCTFPASICPNSFDNTLLDAVDTKDFVIEDIPVTAFSTEAKVDFGEDIDLGDITMPEDEFGENVTLNELGLEDITSPELDDLSISILEGYDPDKSRDRETIQDQQTSPGFLTTVVSAVVDKFRNIFSGTPKDVEEDEDEPSRCINLDSTLPNMFEPTPPPRPTPNIKDPTAFEEPFAIPKYPKEYIAMVKKSQLIYKQEAEKLAEAAKASKRRKKLVVKSTIPKWGQPPGGRGKLGSQKKQEPPAKMYPPGEYSPSYVAAVARARTLAGYKNRSAILNPQRAAKIAALKAAKEAELAAEEALPPVERMRKKLSRLQQKGIRLCSMPSIETLGTLEAIRANLPRPSATSLPKPQWTPASRHRADKNIEEKERVFTKSPIRVFEQFKPMTPLAEESYNEEDLIRFTPLRAREGRLRLKYLKEQAGRRDNDMIHQNIQKDSSTVKHLCTPEAAPSKYSPIILQSPNYPQSEEFMEQTEIPAQGGNLGEESIREEVTKTSTIENGEVHTTTRKVTTKTDELGNVTCHIEESTGLTGEEDAITDNIDAIEAPEFLDISDIKPPRDPTIPTPSEIIDRIRMQVQQKINLVLPEISPDIESPARQRVGLVEFPENLPDEQLYDIDIPEFQTTPTHLFQQPTERSPDTSLPHFWDDEKQPQPSDSCPPTAVTEASTIQRSDHARPLPKSKPIEGPVVIPPCPKDPKDYVGMVLYARAIHKRKQQEKAKAAARTPPPVVVEKKPIRVPISRRIGKTAGKELLFKKKRKNIETKPMPDDVESPTEPPPLPSGYAEEVARARELAGYKNRTAALNPKVAAKLAAEKAANEAALAEFEALSEYQKLLRRMEKLRGIPPQKRRTQDIRTNMPPIDEVSRPKASPTRQTPTCKTTPPKSTIYELQKEKLIESQTIEKQYAELSRNLSIDEFEAIEELCRSQVIAEAQENQAEEDYKSRSLDEFEKHEIQVCEEVAAEELEMQAAEMGRQLNAEAIAEQKAEDEEFEALEREIYGESRTICPSKLSQNEFQSLDKKLNAAYLQTKLLDSGKPKSVAENNYNDDQIRLLNSTKPQSVAEGYSEVLKKIKLQTQLLNSGETPKNIKIARARNIMQEYLDQHEEGRVCPSPGQTLAPSNNQAFYQELVNDFCPVSKQFGKEGEVDFGEFAPSTPVDPKERLSRIKEYQQRKCPMRELNTTDENFTSPSVDYSPVRLFSTPREPRPVIARDISPIQASNKNVLIDLETPRIDYRVKQFKDLEDMPFDELEFEDELSFATASFDKPQTPPPQPSELINRIRQQVQEHLRSDQSFQDQIASVSNFQFLQQLPNENLFELSDPSLLHNTLGGTPTIQRSPRISLPAPSPRVPSPVRIPTPTSAVEQELEVVECPKVPSPVKRLEQMYQPKYPKGYVEMVMKARAMHKIKQQQEAEMAAAAPPSEPAKKKGRIITTKPGGKVVMKKSLVRPPKTVKKKEKQKIIQVDDERECPAEPPPLPPEYLADVARARQLAGYKNRTAALNPEVAREKAAAEAAAAAYAGLSEHEKIKVRMERLRKKSGHKQRVQPNMEQLAVIQAMTEAYGYKTPSRDPSFSTVKSSLPKQRLSTTPRPNRIADMESADLSEFKALEKELVSPDQHNNIQEQLVDKKRSELGDIAYGELRMKTDAQLQQLATPPQLDAREKYRRLLSQVQSTHKTPVPPTPVETPEIHFSPICFASSPTIPKRAQRAEKSTTQITRSGDNTIKEQVNETSEIVNGQLQRVTKLVTTTTDPSGNVLCQINESRHMNAKDTSTVEDELKNIEQPSFLDISPISPTDVPRPRDIIERIRRDVKTKPRPDVPTGQLIELRTPPRVLPLPQSIAEDELFEMSCPALPKTPTKSPVQSPRRSPVRYQDVSIPELFVATPEPPTPPLPPVSPLRYRVHSPEGPIVIPPCPTDPSDYKGMVRMSRKIYELRLQKEAEATAAAEAAAIEASKPKKKERVPISRWKAPPPRRAATRKRLVMKKRAPVEKKLSPDSENHECPSKPPQLPVGYAEEVARARQLAGLRNLTAALNPKVAAKEAVKAAAAAEEARKALEFEAAKAQAFNDPPPSYADYNTVMSRMESMRKHGHVPKVQPSLQAAAYLNAVKGAMDTRQPTSVVESAETRYKRILAARAFSPLPAPEECIMETTPLPEDVQYTPVSLGSPTAKYIDDIGFKIPGLQDIGDLEDIHEPSFLDESQSHVADTVRYIPPSPQTPPPTPSAIIHRIRKQVQQKLADEKLPYPMASETPNPLYFPEDLPEEEIFELTAPSFARTPQSQSPTQIFTPNISIPQYFQPTPQSKLPTPESLSTKRLDTLSANTVKEETATASPPLMGVHPGLRVVTPEGPMVLPPYPKGPESVVEMIRRAQLIHKIKQKEAAAKAGAKVITRTGARVPISRRPGAPTTRPTNKPLRPGKPKENTRKPKQAQLPVECPAEPPQLPPDYVAAVARARRLAGLKNTTALLNPPQDYGTILARVAALKMARGEIEPTAHELAEAQNIIRRPERKEIKEQQQTPRPAVERYRALRSRVHSETPTTSKISYNNPIKTPVLDHVPAYTPVCLPPTPPFFQNINMSDIGDISMPYDMGENQDTDLGDISMPYDMDDVDTAAEDNCVSLCMDEHGRHEDINLGDAMPFDVSASTYCRSEFEYVEPDVGSVVDLESFKSTERSCRAARRR